MWSKESDLSVFYFSFIQQIWFDVRALLPYIRHQVLYNKGRDFVYRSLPIALSSIPASNIPDQTCNDDLKKQSDVKQASASAIINKSIDFCYHITIFKASRLQTNNTTNGPAMQIKDKRQSCGPSAAILINIAWTWLPPYSVACVNHLHWSHIK